MAVPLGAIKLMGVAAQVSKPAVSPTSKSAGRTHWVAAAGLETRDTVPPWLEKSALQLLTVSNRTRFRFGPRKLGFRGRGRGREREVDLTGCNTPSEL